MPFSLAYLRRLRLSLPSGSDGGSYFIRYNDSLPDGYFPTVARHIPTTTPPILATPATLRAKASQLMISPEAVRRRMLASGIETTIAARNAERDREICDLAVQGL